MSPPTSLRKGEGRVRSMLAGALLAGPTSLNRGEVAGLEREVGGGEGGGGDGIRGEDERTSTVMGLMFDSNSAFPHR